MNAIPQPFTAQPMTIEEFLSFTATRPSGELWELIDGKAIMNPSPIDWHQIVVGNIVTHLNLAMASQNALWVPLPGTGTRVPSSANSLPQPDVMVKEHGGTGTSASDDALVLVEVLSRANTRKWRDWRRANYPSIANCQHYFTVSLKRVEVLAYDRSTGWQERHLSNIGDTLDLAALGCGLRLVDMYARTPLAVPSAGPTRRRRHARPQGS